jgi:hypothetical protein
VPVFNGSEALAVAGRDKEATWRTLGTLCRELDWSRPRLISELENGLRYRTFPEGYVIDWHDRFRAQRTLDVAASTVKVHDSMLHAWVTVGIEVLPPTDAELPAPPANTPVASPAPPRKVSEAEVRDALLAIVREHPQGGPPLDEGSLHEELERRLGTPLSVERVRQVRDDFAPQFKRPVGRPRKSTQ